MSDNDSVYTFELFVCTAILRTYRDDLLRTKDVADVFTFINGSVTKFAATAARLLWFLGAVLDE